VNLLDILLAIIIGASLVTGFLAGFARVGIGFLATVTGTLFGFWFYGMPAEWFHRFIKSDTACNLLGFFAVFFGFIFVGALIGKLLSKLFKWTGLSWLDRLMGGAFGFVRGCLIAIAFVAVLLAFTPKPLPNWMVDSRVLPYAIEASNVCASLAPNKLKTDFRESMRDIQKMWDEQLKKKKHKTDLKEVES
jgi:membrane protein required for colicin V production